MGSELRFHPHVATDIRDGYRWYADISVELGESFRRLVDARFDDIADHPEHFPVAFDDVRFAKMKRFPYIILFRKSETAVYVLGVFHGSSNPAKWRGRSTGS